MNAERPLKGKDVRVSAENVKSKNVSLTAQNVLLMNALITAQNAQRSAEITLKEKTVRFNAKNATIKTALPSANLNHALKIVRRNA